MGGDAAVPKGKLPSDATPLQGIPGIRSPRPSQRGSARLFEFWYSRRAKEEALEEGLAATQEEHVTLTGNELREALEAEDRREAERQLKDKKALNDLMSMALGDAIVAILPWRQLCMTAPTS